MSILNVTQAQNMLKTADSASWTNNIRNPKLDLETGIDTSLPNKIHSTDVQPAGRSFGEFLQDSLDKVNSLQQEANTAMEMLATGKSQSLHETLLTVEKAEIAFKTMNQIRSKVLDAYKEVMRMQI